MGSYTSHTALEAIGGLNLTGGGETLREVKLLSSVSKFSRKIRTVVKNPTEFSKETKGRISKNCLTQKESSEHLNTDSILDWNA